MRYSSPIVVFSYSSRYVLFARVSLSLLSVAEGFLSTPETGLPVRTLLNPRSTGYALSRSSVWRLTKLDYSGCVAKLFYRSRAYLLHGYALSRLSVWLLGLLGHIILLSQNLSKSFSEKRWKVSKKSGKVFSLGVFV